MMMFDAVGLTNTSALSLSSRGNNSRRISSRKTANASTLTISAGNPALEAAGLPAEIVSVDALAVFRELIRRELLPRDDKLNALVLVSPTASNIIIYSRGNLMAIRSLVLGAHGVAEAEPRATIHEELQRTLVAAEVEQRGIEAGRVTFATWSEPLRSAVGELARGWGAAAEFLGNGSSPAPSTSVCLEAARAGEVQLNLLPDEWRVQRRSAKRRRTIIRSAIALGAVYVLALAVVLSAAGVEEE